MNHYYKSFETAFAVFSKSSEREQGSAITFAQKLKITTFLLFLFSSMSWGQIANYAFSTSSGNSLTTMTGSSQLLGSASDTSSSAITSIGFNFTFNGVVYTQFSVSANGIMGLGSTVVNSSDTNALTASSTYPIIAPLWDDMHTCTNGKVHYILSGSSPNRKLVVEWLFGNYAERSGGYKKTLQLILNETTNLVEFVYGANSGTVLVSASLGLSSSSTDYNSIKSSNNTASSTVLSETNTSWPSSGTKFSFTPPTPCSGSPTPGTIASNTSQNVCSGGTVAALTVTGTTSGVTGITYQWEQSTDNATWTNATGGTGTTTASYTPPAFGGTTIYYRSKVTCSNSSLFDVTNVATIAPPVNPTTQASSLAFSSVSYTGFSASWTNGNGNRRVVYISNSAIVDPTNTTGAAVLTANTTYSGSGQQIVYDGTGTSVTITGLALGTTYYVKVIEYTRCGSGPYDNFFNVSSGTNSNTVSTIAASAVPWSEGFATTTLPTNWTASSWTLSTVTALNPALSSNYLYVNLDGSPSTASVTTPIIGSITSNYRFVVNYKLANYGSTGTPPVSGSGNFIVEISTDNGTNYTNVETISNNAVAGWQEYVFNLSTYVGQNIRIRLTGNYTSGDYYLAFDNFSVEAIPSCFVPTSLTSSAITYQTATIGWTAPSSGTSPAGYDYEIRTSGAAGSGATGLVTSGSTTAPTASVNLTGLNGGTAHTYYVRSNCGGGDYSSWTSSTFTTSSCSVPTGVTSSSITTTTATISWTAPSGSPSGYEYEVRTSGAAGSGATGLLASGTTTAPTVSASLTGLSASTSYTVYVRTNCYSGFNSSWTSAATLATQCDNITVFPSIFDFATYLPICWQEGDLGDLTAGPSTISSSTSDWVDDGFLNSGSTGSAKMNIDTATGSEWILSPFYSIPASGYRVKYNVGATQFGASTALTTAWESDDFVELLVSTSNSNWSVLKTYNASNVPSYLGQVDTADISAYSGQTVRFAFRAFEGTSNGSADIDFFIDNFTIEQTPNTWTGTASSSWNTAGNWSLNTVPTTGDNVVISSNGTNAPVLDADMTIPVGKSLTISGTGTLTIAPGKTLTIAGTADFGGKAVTFKSDATGSGMFGPLTGTLTGATNVKVERFIPAKRAYRFVSSPVTTTTTIKQNWQENAGTTAGLGTHITGSGGATNGFDATSTDNPSMYTFTSGAWAAVANTNVNVLTAGTPYRLMVRGDRTTDLTTNTPTPTVTTLRATGTLKTGSFSPTINQTADGYSLIGNPYQAPIDIKAILTAASNMNAGVVYYWDPTLNTRGGYVTRDLTTDVNDVTSGFNQYVQPGQAVFVKRDNTANAASITITESHKSVANGAAGVFRTTTPNDYGLLRVNLQANTNNQWQNIEGTLALFNDNFSWNVTSEDATKMSNLDEEVSFVQNNTSLAIACVSVPSANLELPIQLNNLRQSNYQWQFELANYQGERPYLFDTLNNTYTEITNGATVPFTATTTAANRFKIVFQPSALSTDDFANGMVVYPNPAIAGASFFVQGITAAQVTVYNVLGQNIPVQVKSQGNALQVTPTQTLSQGIYLITVTTEGKTQQVKWIVE